jgi:hypothetical protein
MISSLVKLLLWSNQETLLLRVVVLHIGANDLSRGLPVNTVLNKYKKVNEQKRISKDDIYNLVLLAYHMEGYIHEVTVFLDLTTVIALPGMISLVNQLLDGKPRDKSLAPM